MFSFPMFSSGDVMGRMPCPDLFEFNGFVAGEQKFPSLFDLFCSATHNGKMVYTWSSDGTDTRRERGFGTGSFRNLSAGHAASRGTDCPGTGSRALRIPWQRG